MVENSALVSSGFAEQSVPMHFCNLMSLVKGTMKNPAAELEHIRAGREVQKTSSYELSVPARTVTAVLDAHRPPGIDLLSLDVEGYELQALQGLGFTRYRLRYMLIEARFREETNSWLEGFYEPIAILSHHDLLYRSRNLLKHPD